MPLRLEAINSFILNCAPDKKGIDANKKMNKKFLNMIVPFSTSNQLNGSWPLINHFV